VISTLDNMFTGTIIITLVDRNGSRGVSARLEYTEDQIKERFFMPSLRWWGAIVFWVGIFIGLLLIPT
jgi:hypothetical protein